MLKWLFVLGLPVVAIIATAPSCSNQSIADWNPKTAVLDSLARHGPEGKQLAEAIKTFYQVLHDKQWEASYTWRTAAYRSSVPLTVYLTDASKDGQDWELLDYEVLNVHMYNDCAALVLCRFTEAPGPVTAYEAVCWKKEGGQWKCEEAGPARLAIFARMSPFECKCLR